MTTEAVHEGKLPVAAVEGHQRRFGVDPRDKPGDDGRGRRCGLALLADRLLEAGLFMRR